MSKTAASQASADRFPPEIRDAVWGKTHRIPGWDEDCRTDDQGNPIFRPHYLNAQSGVGWEIAYKVDPADGGAEDLSNLVVRAVEPREEA
jgi:hypothetical protein